MSGVKLNDNWYVEYGLDDPLHRYLGESARDFIGLQVIGDGGDLTSNVD
jgi:hypothetical protein